jgi:hypothetical protein
MQGRRDWGWGIVQGIGIGIGIGEGNGWQTAEAGQFWGGIEVLEAGEVGIPEAVTTWARAREGAGRLQGCGHTRRAHGAGTRGGNTRRGHEMGTRTM